MFLSHSSRREPALVSLLLFLINLFDAAKAIPTVSVTGSKFFDSNGNQFYVKGVFYEVDSDDKALAATEQCKIDAKLMKELGVNTVRVRNVDATTDSRHDGCMSAFEDAGIYVLVHLHRGKTGVSLSNPEWNGYMFDRFTDVLDTFSKYDNLLGFLVDNVLSGSAGPESGPYIKAAISDMKAYRDSKGYRSFPIGYAEGYDTDVSLGKYLTCGDEAVDFYAWNGDAACSSLSDAEESLNDFAIDASEFNVPVFEGNVGCPKSDYIVKHQKVLLDTTVSNVMSGGSIYTWVDFDDAGNPHMVTFPDDEIKDKPVTPTKNNPYFSDLQKVWKESKPSTTAKSAYNAPTGTVACPSSDGDWASALSRPLPTLADTLISSSGAAPSGTNTGTSDSDALNGEQQDDGGSDSGISTGAKIAIGVVIPVVFIMGALAAFLIYRRRQQKRRQAQELQAMSGSGMPPKEPPVHTQHQGYFEKEQPDQIPPRPELDQSAGYAPGQYPARELEGSGAFVGELEDTSRTDGRGANVSR